MTLFFFLLIAASPIWLAIFGQKAQTLGSFALLLWSLRLLEAWPGCPAWATIPMMTVVGLAVAQFLVSIQLLFVEEE